VKVSPDVTGSYSVLVSANATGVENYTSGDVSASFTISTGSAPTAVTLTTLAGATILAGSPRGAAVLVTLTGGTVTGLEGITLTTSGSGSICIATCGTSSNYGTSKTLTSTHLLVE